MKQLLIIFFCCCAGFSGIAQPSGHWRTVTAPTQKDLLAVSFPTAQTGYVCGKEGLIMKTTDGGESWQVLQPAGLGLNAATPDIIDIRFLTASLGYAIVSNYVSPAFQGVLYTTSDGGATWSMVEHGQAVAAYRVYFFDEDLGWLAGAAFFAGRVVCRKNGDGWDAYHYFSNSPDEFIKAIDFYSGKRGAIAGDNGIVYTTNDSGITWTPHPVNIGLPVDSAINDLKFLDENTIVACTQRGTIPAIISHDFGESWQSLWVPITFNYPAMTAVSACKNDSVVTAGRDNNNWSFGGYITWWNGSDWQQEMFGSGLNHVGNPTDSTVFAVGDTGLIITNKLIPNSIDKIEKPASFVVYPNPARDVITLKYDASIAIREVEILDVSGRKIKTRTGSFHTIPVSGIAAGLYLLKVQTGKGYFTERLVISR